MQAGLVHPHMQSCTHAAPALLAAPPVPHPGLISPPCPWKKALLLPLSPLPAAPSGRRRHLRRLPLRAWATLALRRAQRPATPRPGRLHCRAQARLPPPPRPGLAASPAALSEAAPPHRAQATNLQEEGIKRW